jgi:hypothetical protein
MEGKTWCDLAGWPGKIRLKTRLQPVDFCFVFTKTTSFWFFKKIDLGDPVTQSKPGTRVLDRAGSKNYVQNNIFQFIMKVK